MSNSWMEFLFLNFLCSNIFVPAILHSSLFSIPDYGKHLKSLKLEIPFKVLTIFNKSKNSAFPAGNYMFKVNNKSLRTRREICLK